MSLPLPWLRTTIVSYTLLTLILAIATLIEPQRGTLWVQTYIYQSPYMIALWVVNMVCLIAGIRYRRQRKGFAMISLHLSFILILLGAACTYLTGSKGGIHLRTGDKTQQYSALNISTDEQSVSDKVVHTLPFTLRLDSFRINYYPGTMAAADYRSYVQVTMTGDKTPQHAVIAMNSVLQIHGYRLYQSSYDQDGKGTYLMVNYDPFGTPLTYAGYALLALSWLWILGARDSGFRRLLRHTALQKGSLCCLCFFGLIQLCSARTLPALTTNQADRLRVQQVVYQERITPFNTLATDFLRKVYGHTSYHGLQAEQVVGGWLLRPDAWQYEPMIHVPEAALRLSLGLDSNYVRFVDLFDKGEYRLQHLPPTFDHTPTALQKAQIALDERIGLILLLTQGKLIVPAPTDGSVSRLNDTQVQAEILYNRLPFTTLFFIINLTLGFLASGRLLYGYLRGIPPRVARWTTWILYACLYLSTALLLSYYLLRWYIGGRIPLSNGFETMLFVSLSALILTCIMHRRFTFTLPFGFLVAGFTLLVAHLAQANPQITPLMPVLVSPWLSIHVSCIMLSYALLSFVLLQGILGLVIPRMAARLEVLSCVCLYPALALLSVGIFLGAVWANNAWGRYWAWDPKEVWALVTLLVYSVLLHRQYVPALRKPRYFHCYAILAFLCVLMTYFGVNYVLGGMHSYANS